nr:zinc ribbon domain-containing protein [Entomohabitans teleogrylli]
MRILGWLVLLVGAVWLIVALNMNVTVWSESGNYVNNFGLMAERQNHTIIGGVILICGVLMIALGKKMPTPNYDVKCPFCAEYISPDAIKCKHCGSDIKHSAKINSDVWVAVNFYYVDDGEAKLNRGAVADLVCEMKIKNQNYSPVKLMIKYQDKIKELQGKLPPNIRDEFLGTYKEFM